MLCMSTEMIWNGMRRNLNRLTVVEKTSSTLRTTAKRFNFLLKANSPLKSSYWYFSFAVLPSSSASFDELTFLRTCQTSWDMANRKRREAWNGCVGGDDGNNNDEDEKKDEELAGEDEKIIVENRYRKFFSSWTSNRLEIVSNIIRTINSGRKFVTVILLKVLSIVVTTTRESIANFFSLFMSSSLSFFVANATSFVTILLFPFSTLNSMLLWPRSRSTILRWIVWEA